jgi:mRNA-degrading endonuclease RelE of RelBE toxin-antitoxin system
MPYEVKGTSVFERQAKRLVKKYASLKAELLELYHELGEDPLQGKSLGKNCYKIRLAIASKGKGKSGGARVISHFLVEETTVYLLSIYDKSEKSSLSDKELDDLLKGLNEA